MKQTVIETIKSDFEKFMRYTLQTQGNFGFDIFGDYAVSVLNFYVGSSIFPIQEKEEAAKVLVQLYNGGLKNSISTADQQEIVVVLIKDPTLNYTVLQPIFN